MAEQFRPTHHSERVVLTNARHIRMELGRVLSKARSEAFTAKFCPIPANFSAPEQIYTNRIVDSERKLP